MHHRAGRRWADDRLARAQHDHALVDVEHLHLRVEVEPRLGPRLVTTDHQRLRAGLGQGLANGLNPDDRVGRVQPSMGIAAIMVVGVGVAVFLVMLPVAWFLVASWGSSAIYTAELIANRHRALAQSPRGAA